MPPFFASLMNTLNILLPLVEHYGLIVAAAFLLLCWRPFRKLIHRDRASAGVIRRLIPTALTRRNNAACCAAICRATMIQKTCVPTASARLQNGPGILADAISRGKGGRLVPENSARCQCRFAPRHGALENMR